MSETPVKRPKKRGWTRFLVYLIVLSTALLVGGFLSFAYTIDHQGPPETVPVADGIVVWTGKGGDRLSAGANLLSKGRGERLLISGVNENNSREQILALLDVNSELAECCVDLDYAARDTIGNARETANWTRAMGYDHIILVTSSYHMPRAEIEIAASRKDIRITPYPVSSNNNEAWWKSQPRMRQILTEYGKLLVTLARRSGSGDRA